MAQSEAIGSTVPTAYYPVGFTYPTGSTVLVEGGNDSGARFGAGTTAGNIPLHLLDTLQMALGLQGANVPVTQQRGNFFMGGTDGGHTIW